MTDGLVRLPTFTSKQNTSLTTDARTWPSSTTQQWCWWQFQSEPLHAGYSWTTSNTVSMVIGKCGEPSNLAADTHLAYVVRVVSNDGLTIRGVIGLYLSSSSEFSTIFNASTRIHTSRTDGATTFNSQVNDRIIIEIGVHGSTPDTVEVQMRYGDPSATNDFALTPGLTTDLVPWVELSKTVVLGSSSSSSSSSST